jgi:hypothetical protein
MKGAVDSGEIAEMCGGMLRAALRHWERRWCGLTTIGQQRILNWSHLAG